MAGGGRCCCVGGCDTACLAVALSIALTARVGVALVVVVSLGRGIADVPGIMRAYCEGQSLAPMSHSRFVLNSLIGFTGSGKGLAAQGNDALRARCQEAELG